MIENSPFQKGKKMKKKKNDYNNNNKRRGKNDAGFQRFLFFYLICVKQFYVSVIKMEMCRKSSTKKVRNSTKSKQDMGKK